MSPNNRRIQVRFPGREILRLAMTETGTSLPELMMTIGVSAICLMVAASVISYSSVQAHSLDLSSQALSDKTLFRYEQQTAVENCIEGKVWLNQQVAAALFVPWPATNPVVTDGVGAIGVLKNTLIDPNGTVTPDATSLFDAFYFIQKVTSQVPITLDVSGGADPGYILDVAQTSQTFNIMAGSSLAGFSVGSYVAVETVVGTQFAKITAETANTLTLDWSSLGTFSIQSVTHSWPVLYLTAGISIFPVLVGVVAANSTRTSINFFKVNPQTGALMVIDTLSYTPISMQLTDNTNLGQFSNYLQLHQTPFEILTTLSVQANLILHVFKIEQPL